MKSAIKPFLLLLREDFQKIGEALKETYLEVISNQISSYPIVIAHEDVLPFGETLVEREEEDLHYSYRLSTLDDFVKQGLIPADRAPFFKEEYKNPNEQVCVFLVSRGGARFVFVPHTSDKKEV